MGSQERGSNIPLKERLLKDCHHFSFFQAVGLLESLLPEKKPLGETLAPFEEPVRFTSKPGFVFPSCDISKMEYGDESKPVDMEVSFMGLVGPSGVLPHWYNEQVLERLRNNDHGQNSFYNIFNHRLISLFYLAWKKHRLCTRYKPGEKDRVSNYFLCLTGLGTSGLIDRIGLPENSLVHYYSGLLSRHTPSSSVAIEAVVSYFSGISAKVEQFIERLLPINQEDQTQMGMANCQLGIDAVCGSYVWENQTKFRVHLGPMGFDDFFRFMPNGKMLRPLFSLIRQMAGIEYEFEIALILKREEVPDCVLGGNNSWLGWSTWVKSEGIMHKDNPSTIFQEMDL